MQAVLPSSCSKEWVRDWASQCQAGCGGKDTKEIIHVPGLILPVWCGAQLGNARLPSL